MKLYVISGLGADFKVLEKIKFPQSLEIVFLAWLIPEKNETFKHYIERMSKKIDFSEPYCLLGYSFGGIVVQEIHKIKPAEKIVVLGSIRSDKEKSHLMKFGQFTNIPKFLPEKFYNYRSAVAYAFLRKLFDPKNPKIFEYFRVKDPYYLKWSIEKIVEWQCEECKDVIQILGDKDIVFPIKNSNPDYVIKGGTHLFPVTKHKEVSDILFKIFS